MALKTEEITGLGTSKNVTPAKAGVQKTPEILDSGFRRNDKHGVYFTLTKKILILSLSLVCFASFAEASAPVSFVKKKWVVKLKQNSFFNRKPYQFAKPVVDGDKIFVGVQRGFFYGIDAKRGKKLWVYRTQGPIYASARVEGDIVYFSDFKGTVYALNKETGKLIWISKVDGEVMSAPLLLEDKIYVVTLARELAQLDRATGNILWQTSQPFRERGFSIVGAADPVFAEGRILAGFSDGSFAAFNPANGDMIWSKQLGERSAEFRDVDGTVLLAGGLAYVSSAEGRMFALNPKTGEIVWEAPFGGVNDAALADDLLYVTAGGVVYCVKAASGEQIWEQALDIPGISSPALYDKWLAVVATKGKIYFVDRINGDVLYGYYVKGGSYSSPIMVENRLYLLSNASRLYAFQYK